MTRLQEAFSLAPADGSLTVGLVAARYAGHGQDARVDSFLLGRAGAAMQGFFPEVAARAKTVVARRPSSAKMVLVLIPYEQFLPMAWRSLAARRLMPAFADIAHGLVTCPRGWADVVADLVQVLHPAETLILSAPMQAFPAVGATLPDTALAMVQRLYRLSVNLPPRQMARLAEVHRRLPQPEPIAAFSAVQTAALRARYAADLARLATMPGLWIEEPARQQAAA